jgi:hypothetical protein
MSKSKGNKITAAALATALVYAYISYAQHHYPSVQTSLRGECSEDASHSYFCELRHGG